MRLGTVIKIEDTCGGCLGAIGHVGIVTASPSTYGLATPGAGYNVALANGQIWRINKDAKVKILYAPPTV